jgi:DNA repair photolyase
MPPQKRSTRFRDPIRGRGTQHDLPNRFETLAFEPDPEQGFEDGDAPAPETSFLRDPSRTALARNQSPDVGFDTSLNPYRGCEHGCAYCYARPTHEYLGFSPGLDFERRILVKPDAPALLRRELSRRSWVPQVIAFSGVTDCYQPVERRLGITRGCLEVLAEFRNPVSVITKSRLVVRDVELLQRLAEHRACSVTLSVTTLDDELARRLEPRAAQPRARLAAVEALARAGVPVGILVAPVIPALTDSEIPRIVEAAAAAGASWAGFVLLRLPHGVKQLFDRWLEDHLPERRAHVLSRLRQLRGGRLYDPRWRTRQRGEGIFAEQTLGLMQSSRRRHGLADSGPELSAAAFRVPGAAQVELFGGG